jgi:AcrR family transcriptional regulator
MGQDEAMTAAAGSRSTRGKETRARILKAARTLLSEGTDRFTTRKVADLAEVSHGMCHYHFATKRDLVVALMDDARQDWIDPLWSFVRSEDPAVTRAKQIVSWMGEPATAEVMRVHQALYRSALDDDTARQRLADQYAEWRGGFVKLFEDVAVELELEDIDPVAIGGAFASAADGLVQQQSLDAALDTQGLLWTLFERLTYSGASPKSPR